MLTPHQSRTVHIKHELVLSKLRERKWTLEELALRLDVSPTTVSNWIKHDKAAYWNSVTQLQSLLNIECIEDLIRDPQVDQSGSAIESIHEWNVECAISPWITASNQLQFQVCRLKHQHVSRFARGKRYELRNMSTKEKERCREQLLRHAQVSTTLGKHPHIIQNLTTFPSPRGDAWWVIDEWIEGPTLHDAMRRSQFHSLDVRKLLLQIGEALEALHLARIIRRELSPAAILLREPTRDAVLTEFELAKLTDGSPTVSRDDWPTDPYRAPEACTGDLDKHADIYAWARLAVHLLLGELPEKGAEAKIIRAAKFPKQIEDLFLKCLSISWRNRPSSFDVVLNELRQWK